MIADIQNLEALRKNIVAMSQERKPRVLIVDDNAYDANTLKQQIEEQCVPSEIEVSQSCEDAEVRLLNGRYDLVLLDLLFPSMSGVELLRRLGPMINNTYFIGITGLDDDAPPCNEALKLGAFAVMSKPFSPPQIRGLCGLT